MKACKLCKWFNKWFNWNEVCSSLMTIDFHCKHPTCFERVVDPIEGKFCEVQRCDYTDMNKYGDCPYWEKKK